MMSTVLIFLALAAHVKSLKAPLMGMGASGIVKDEYLVTVKDPSIFKETAQEYGLEIQREFHIENWHAALVVAGRNAIEGIREHGNIVMVEANHQTGLKKGFVNKAFHPEVSYVEAQKINMLHDNKSTKDEYIVQVKGGTDEINFIRKQFRASILSTGHNMEIGKEFHVKDWQALVVKMDSETADILRSNPNISLVEKNMPVEMFSTPAGTTSKSTTTKNILSTEMFSTAAGTTSKSTTTKNILSTEMFSTAAGTTSKSTTTKNILSTEMFSTAAGTTSRSTTTKNTLTTQTVTEIPCQKQNTGDLLWGLSSISNHDRGDYSSAVYKYGQHDDGQEVDIYILDSGVFLEHEEFEGRAIWGMTATRVSNEGHHDQTGHGTHVASTAAGKTYGVAKKATITAVKVLGRNGEGYISDIVEGIEWTVDKIKNKTKEGRSVVNLSLGSPNLSTTLESAVQNAIDARVIITIAAGNDKLDACGTTPARSSAAIVVGASDINDKWASFSNFGPCVDIAAPGVNILGANKTHASAASFASGTSMAAPHVAGVIARYLSSLQTEVNPSPAEVRQHILDTSLNGYLELSEIWLDTTPNRLLYTSCGVAVQKPPSPSDPSEVCHRQQTRRDRWSLTRTSSKKSPADYKKGDYHYSEDDDGEGVDIYVLDTGVYLYHSDFEGRASWGFTASSMWFEGNSDLQGHGTHVASLAAGKTYGTAKAANIISVKVLDRHGHGNSAGVIEGLQWVSTQVENKKNNVVRPKGSVVNLSLGLQGDSYSLERVIQKMVQAGITFVAAAGNDKKEACFTSPARMSSVITVGATDIRDDLASFSNYGSCVDILAPGQSILGASNEGPGLSAYSSGTSQAAPHVAGVVARYMSSFPDKHPIKTPEQAKAFIVDTATREIIDLHHSHRSTPNLLLFAGCGKSSGNQNLGLTIMIYVFTIVLWLL